VCYTGCLAASLVEGGDETLFGVLWRLLSEKDAIQQGISVRLFGIFFHLFQRIDFLSIPLVSR